MNEKRLLAILAGVVGVLVLAVIGVSVILIAGRSDDGDGGTQSSGQSGSTGPREAGELRLPGDDPLTLDPALVTDVTSAVYVVELFGGLVTLDKNLQIVPDIAKEWTISEDGKTYTFMLRDDVVFTNSGRRVTAADFKYSMERAADPKTDSPVADTYLGDIVGAKDMIRGRTNEISGIKVVDDTTLQIEIDASKPYFLSKMTYPTAFVVDKDQIARDSRNWTRRPNGTGPFKLQEWRIGERVVLVPNEQYHGDVKPQVSKVTYNLAGGSVLTQYENGEVDIAGVGVNDIERIRDTSERLNKEFVEKPELSTSYIAFNTQQPPFDDVKVRQAFAYAIDKDRIADVILRDLVPPANTILPPGLPGYSAQQNAIGFDPERAKQLLAESKYGSSLPRIVLTMSGTGANLGPTTEAILEMWRQTLGVEVEVEQVETATFFQDVRRGKFQMWSLGWQADYPDPEDFLDIHFYSQSQHNETKYSNPQVDALLLKARTEQDSEVRMRTYREAEAIILQELPWIPLFHGAASVLVKPYVKGWEPTGLVIPILKYVSVER
ncbi:MAG: peptide ABC transporter substrate-binding protein [Dehalococcoidia bacterium]